MTEPAGRFAPSPTGPLHFGSLLAATASFLDARQQQIRWLVRIDDLDAPRNVPGSVQSILHSLEAHGLCWDGEVVYQSHRLAAYRAALQSLEGQLFYCTCSRRRLSDRPLYPGTCRWRRTPCPDAAIRIRVDQAAVRFHDLIAGPQEEIPARTCGDFVVRRRDGLMAYQLATAVDDGRPEITRVVRGGDLLSNTARQIYLMRRLGSTVPTYAHLPVLVGKDGAKLSKQTHAPALDDSKATANLLRIFPCLGLHAPAEAAGWTPGQLLSWAVSRFDLQRIRGGSLPFRS